MNKWEIGSLLISFFGFFIDFLVISLSLNFGSLSIALQACQHCKVLNVEILAKDLKKPEDSVKNLEVIVGYFFRSDKLGFFTLNNIHRGKK